MANLEHPTASVQVETDSKDNNSLAENQKTLLEAVLRQLPVGVAIGEADTHRVVMYNEALSQIWKKPIQRTAVESYEHEDWVAFHSDGSPVQPHEWPLSKALNGTIVTDEELSIVRGDGSRAITTQSAAPIYLNGKIIAGVITVIDTTERNGYQEHLERLTQELQRSNNELEQFAYIASHDLKEPLRTIMLHLEVLRRTHLGEISAEADVSMRIVLESSRKMSALISGLLAYAQVETNFSVKEKLNSSELVKQALEFLEAQASECQAEILFGDLPKIEGNRMGLIRLFQNLISNAIKYRGTEPPRILISAVLGPDRKSWVFSVRDNGIGFDMAHASKLFQIFKRLHSGKEFSGTGIGLAICKKIVEYHGGKIWVESKPLDGSTFFFSLPCTASE